jgi:hypothetical protein
VKNESFGQEHCHVLPAETSYKNAFFSRNRILQLLEPVLVNFQLLSKLLFSKLVPVELIVPGIFEANVLIWLQFRQAFPRLAQRSV